MTWPKLSIIWLNYNSTKFIDVALESLESITDLDYPENNYELIVVDNASNDGSFEKIEDFLSRKGRIRKKLIRLNKNLGFTGGNNIGYRARDPESKYIVLMNNDMVPTKESLKLLVEHVSVLNKIGAFQGILSMYRDKNVIENFGFIVDEFLASYAIYRGENLGIAKKTLKVSYTSGAYSIYNIEALHKTGLKDKLFHDFMTFYFDDNYIGLKLWNSRHKCVALPLLAGYHLLSASFTKLKPLAMYHKVKGWLVLNEISNSRYRKLIKTLALCRYSMRTPIRNYEILFKGIKDGFYFASLIKERIDIYKAPILRIVPLYLPLILIKAQAVELRYRAEIEKFSLEE